MKNNLQLIFKYLSVYLSASMDITSAMDLICRRIRHRKLYRIFSNIHKDINQGKSMVSSFSILREKNIIDPVSWAMFVSAEHGGSIEEACMSISKNIEFQKKNANSLLSALAYPIGMCLASFAMVVFLVVYAFPKITPLFASFNAPVPKLTLYILNVSTYLSNWGIHMSLACTVILFGTLYTYKNYASFTYIVQFTLLRTPLISYVFLYREYSTIASSMQSLLRSNCSLIESLNVTSEICSFIPFKDQLSKIRDRIQHGQKISHSFEKESLFNNEWVDLISVGETTGRLTDSFKDISNLYADKYKDAVSALLRVSEPVALLCTAIVVLIIALSVITPMYSIIQQVQQ